MSLRFHLFVSDVSQGNEDLEWNKVGSRFSCMAPGMERFYFYLSHTIKKMCLGNVMWGCVEGDFFIFFLAF